MSTSQLTIQAQFEEMEKLGDFLKSQLSDLTDGTPDHVVLAVHELCVNIIQHGYVGTPGEIHIQAERTPEVFQINIQDNAPNAYNPPDEIVPPDPLSLPESGWGMYIVHQVFDEMHYRRAASGNTWYLAKNL